ncbi:septation ring formation regulator EzrA [Mollicutes bacterium LVI A0078]|nr:septation ring formation regulator EzrA [Mollicutes bacterium LVI A0075]WOO90846.1 septation ring formation regulator EzrA [Mollicutes bacterium LVI A0078]
MDNISLQIVLIAIVIAALVAIVLRTVMRKNKREELFKVTKEKYEEIQKLFIDSGEALDRADQISKDKESITLFNRWYKEYKDLEIELGDLQTDYNEVYKYYQKGQHKDFLESNKSLGFKIEAISDKIALLHKTLFNYTSYELENTQIALDLKTSIKEIQNAFELNLAVKEIYTQSFENECEKVERELTRFEDLQKLGKYPKARKHLKNATEFINKLEYNYNIITNMSGLCGQLNDNIGIIDEVSKHISDRKFRLDQDEYLQNYDSLKEQKTQIEQEIDNFTFAEKITEEYVAGKEREIGEIQDSIFNIKESIQEQYAQIKVIEGHIKTNEELFEQSDRLVAGALEERDEINHLYQMPENKAIQKLEVEVKRYNQFKKDYEVLLDLVYDLKESYDVLASRVSKSNEYIKHFITNMKSAIDGLKEIRTDEIKALESIDNYKQRVTEIEFYLSNQEHIHEMSNPLSNLLNEAYLKIEKLAELLDETPLNISDVRKLTIASETLLADLEVQAEEEIKTRAQAQGLIMFANRYVEDTKSQDILSHAMTLYNTHNYKHVVQEIRQVVHNDFENPELLYKQILDSCEFQTINTYREGN